jgi:hypothetical protein
MSFTNDQASPILVRRPRLPVVDTDFTQVGPQSLHPKHTHASSMVFLLLGAPLL